MSTWRIDEVGGAEDVEEVEETEAAAGESCLAR
jgi:hypothetical protein